MSEVHYQLSIVSCQPKIRKRQISARLDCEVKKLDGEVLHLILECQDFDGDKSGNKEVKRHYLKDYWIPAANNLKTYGTWDLLEVRDIDRLEEKILEKVC